MTPAEHYRALAAECGARAHNEPRSEYRCLWENLVRSYRLLGRQADRTSRIDAFYGQISGYERPRRVVGKRGDVLILPRPIKA
jgi:hypothetical protein